MRAITLAKRPVLDEDAGTVCTVLPRLRTLAPLLLICAACDDDAPADEPFSGTGGTLAIEGCGYSVTTRVGAEPPRIATGTIGADPTPRHVHLGFIGDPRTSMVVQWRTKDETTRATVIRYAAGADLPADQLTEQTTGIQFGYKATGSEIYRVHQAHLCGLAPGTAYSYQVGAEGALSPVYTFRTAPDVTASPDAEVVLGFVGDTRDGYDVWSQLVGQLQQQAPDLILFSGDAVTIGITQFEWEEFFDRGEPLFARVPVLSAHGNHEVNSVNFYAQFAMPGDQENFSFDYGHAHITVANDSPDDPGTILGSTRDFLAADFEASKTARWRMLMHHRAMWSSSTVHGSSLELQQAWMPLIDQHRIDLVLNGHDHLYEISKPMRGGAVQPSNMEGTVYVVNGGAGAELYEPGTSFHQAYTEKSHSAALVRVTQTMLALDPFRQDGTAITVPEAKFSKSKP